MCPLGEILAPVRKATTLLPEASPLILLDEGQVCRAPYQYVSLWCRSSLGLIAVEGEGYLSPLLERQDIVLHASVITIGYLQWSPDLPADVFLN